MSLRLKHSNTGLNYLGVCTLRLHNSTCTFVSGRLLRANVKGISILEKMLCLIVGREGRRERKWWASSYQVSPNTVSCVLTHLHTYTSPYPHIPTPTHLHPRLHTHMHIPTYISSHPHIPTPTVYEFALSHRRYGGCV